MRARQRAYVPASADPTARVLPPRTIQWCRDGGALGSGSWMWVCTHHAYSGGATQAPLPFASRHQHTAHDPKASSLQRCDSVRCARRRESSEAQRKMAPSPTQDGRDVRHCDEEVRLLGSTRGRQRLSLGAVRPRNRRRGILRGGGLSDERARLGRPSHVPNLCAAWVRQRSAPRHVARWSMGSKILACSLTS